MKIYTAAAIVLMLASVPVRPAFAGYPGEPTPSGNSYDAVRDINYNFQLGKPDETVREAQKVLRDQGYYHGPLDGVRNPQYRTALWNFQRAKGITSTMHLDGPTMAALGLSAPGAGSPGSTSPSNFGGSPDPALLNEVEAP